MHSPEEEAPPVDALVPPFVANRLVKHWLVESRQQANVSQRDAGLRIERGQPMIARLESDDPQRLPTEQQLVTLLDLYGRPELIDLMKELLDVARQSSQHPDQPVMLPDFELLMGLEMFAQRIQAWSSIVINGLLQTRAYAQAVIRGSAVPQHHLDVENLLNIRAFRRSVLTRQNNPVHGQFWTEEGVLRRPIGGTQVHAGQLTNLLNLGGLDNIEIRVIRSDVTVHPGVGGSFSVIHDRTGGRVAYEETRQQALYYGTHTQLREYEDVLAVFDSIALSPNDSRQLIEEILKEVRRQ